MIVSWREMIVSWHGMMFPCYEIKKCFTFAPSWFAPMPDYNIYIHIPFCRSRCAYCDFYSTTLGAAVQHDYAIALCREIRSRVSGEVSNVYVGGGTPSWLSTEDLALVVKTLHSVATIKADAEMTIEANPDDISEPWLRSVAEMGFNRLSVGVQSFRDETLRFVGRRHTAREAENAILLARNMFSNLSLDLIYGLPGQTIADVRHDVQKAIALGVQHISAYALTYEEGTRLWHLRKQGSVVETPDEDELSMYSMIQDELKAVGFEHYEISNFALPGFRAKHNSGYWNGTPYIGLGPSAHSYDGVTRRWNASDVKAYITAQGNSPFEQETISAETAYEELVMTRLRTCEGLCLTDVPSQFLTHFNKQISPHLRAGRLEIRNGRLRLTREGLFCSDDVISDLFL